MDVIKRIKLSPKSKLVFVFSLFLYGSRLVISVLQIVNLFNDSHQISHGNFIDVDQKFPFLFLSMLGFRVTPVPNAVVFLLFVASFILTSLEFYNRNRE